MTKGEPAQDVQAFLRAAKEASYAMALLGKEEKTKALSSFAQLLKEQEASLLEANQKDLESNRELLSSALLQRLKLDAAKLSQIRAGIRDIAEMPDPVGKVLERTLLDDGLVLEKCAVPIGVIAVVFESRPDVVPQIVSLILKTGNVIVFKGGREAACTNQAFMSILDGLQEMFSGIPKGWAQMLHTREAFHELLSFPEYVDLVIPRGSKELVSTVMKNTHIPVLGHADGVCHLFVDESADIETAVRIAVDAKSQYPAACNSIETLLVNSEIAPEFLSAFFAEAERTGITIKGCELTRKILPGVEATAEEDWQREYGDLTLSIRIVSSLQKAVAHINRYGSHHTDAIVSSDEASIEAFLNGVDSAGVYANASTRFADGYRYGFGAEVGISTSKIHARGPVGLDGLLSYKYKLRGTGQVVQDYVGENAREFRHERLIG